MKITKIEKVGKLPVYDISVKEAESYVTENGVVSHNTGIYYAANDIWIIGRAQEKDGTEISGYTFTITIEKSRKVKEKSKIPVTVVFGEGIYRWSALLDLAQEGGFIVKPKNGWYQLAGEEKSYREKDTGPLLENLCQDEKFKEFIEKKYKLSNNKVVVEDVEDSEEE